MIETREMMHEYLSHSSGLSQHSHSFFTPRKLWNPYVTRYPDMVLAQTVGTWALTNIIWTNHVTFEAAVTEAGVVAALQHVVVLCRQMIRVADAGERGSEDVNCAHVACVCYGNDDVQRGLDMALQQLIRMGCDISELIE